MPCLVAALLTIATACTFASDGSFHLHGVVRDSARGTPIPDAQIVLIGAQHGTRSSSDGHFHLSNLSPGNYRLGIRRLGYYDRVQTIELSRDTTIDVFLVPLSIELKRVIVEGSRPLARGTEHEVQLDWQYLDRHRGQTFGDLLTDVPGVSLLQTGPAITKPVLRGLHSERVVITSGGIQHRAQEWGLDHGPALDPFLPTSVAVIRGVASIEESYAAIGGVIRIEPPPLRYHREFAGQLSLLGATNNGMGAAAVRAQGSDLAIPNTAYLLYASGTIAGDSRTPQYVLSNTGARTGSAMVAIGYDAASWRSEISYSLFAGELGILAASHLGNPDDLRRAIEVGRPLIVRPWTYSIGNPRQEILHQTLYLHSTYTTDAGTLELQYGWQHNDRSEYDAHAARYTDSTLLQQALRRPALELSLASYQLELRYRFSDGTASSVLGFHLLRQSNVRSGQVFLLPDYLLYEGGFLGTRTFTIGSWLASFGARGDLQWMRARPYNKAAGRYDPDTTMLFAGIAANGGIERTIGGSSRLRINLGTYWRPPLPVELFANDLHHGTAQYEIGDRKLRTERSVSFDASITTMFGRMQLEATAYAQYFPRLTQLLPDSMPTVTYRGVFPTMRYVQQRAATFGTELSASLPIGSILRFDAQAAIIRGIRLPAGDCMAFMPADRLRLALHLHPSALLGVHSPYFELAATAVRRQTAISPSVFDYAPPPAGYIAVDLTAGGQWVLAGTLIQTTLRIQNLLDTPFRDYLSRYRYFALNPGRNITFIASIPFHLSNQSSEELQ